MSDEIERFKKRHGLGVGAEVARKVDLSFSDQAELRRFFEVRAESAGLSDDDVIRIVLAELGGNP